MNCITNRPPAVGQGAIAGHDPSGPNDTEEQDLYRIRAAAVAARADAGIIAHRRHGWWRWPDPALPFTLDGIGGPAGGDHSYLAVQRYPLAPVYCTEPYEQTVGHLSAGYFEDFFRDQWAPLLAQGWRLSVTREGAIHFPGHTLLIALHTPGWSPAERIARLRLLTHATRDPEVRRAVRRRCDELAGVGPEAIR